MYKYTRFRTSLAKGWVSPNYLKENIVREPKAILNRLHPKAKKIYNKMIHDPLPLKYKLKSENLIVDTEIPLGDTLTLPFQVSFYNLDN